MICFGRGEVGAAEGEVERFQLHKEVFHQVERELAELRAD